MWPVKTDLVGGVFSVHVPTYSLKMGNRFFFFKFNFIHFRAETLLESFSGTSTIYALYAVQKLRLVFHITHRVIYCFYPENAAMVCSLIF